MLAREHGRKMVRKGRCSNDPTNCTLAGQKAELPYAGIDSVCPECGSPLAALALGHATRPAAAAPIAPPPTPAPPPPPLLPPAPVAQSEYQYPPRSEPQHYNRQPDFDGGAREPSNNAMKLTQMVIIGVATALIGFFAWRMFLQPRPVEGPEIGAAASVASAGDQQVTQISPAQLRRLSVASQAHSVPDAAGSIVGGLAAGSVLDVTGQVNVNGVNWLRISLPNDSSRSGFVRENQMESMGDPSLTISPTDPMTGTLPPGTVLPNPALPAVIGPVQAREPATFYVASIRANIRQEADAASAKVGAFEFTDPITVVGQRAVGTNIWYQVQLPSGGNGWINGRLISATPRDIPIDRAAAASTATVTKQPSKPSFQPDAVASDVGKSDNQAAMTAVGPGTTIRVDASVANLRKEPGATGNSIIEVLQRDTLLSVEDVRIINGVPWYRVTSRDRAQGWVSGRTVVENN